MKTAVPLKITLRTASIDDLPLILHWDEQPHVKAAVPDDDWNWAQELQRFPAWREQLIAELNGRTIGFIQIIDPAEEETNYWGAVSTDLRAIDICIGEVEDLGKGYGTVMMHLALERCFAPTHVSTVLIDPLQSNTKAIRFYKRLGFEFVENRRLEDCDCAVYKMTREIWENKKSEI